MAGISVMDASLERLYSVYARYPLPQNTDFCDHCVSLDDIANVRSKPLRDLTASDLEVYAEKGLSTWGDLAEFKHFLPRLLELAAREDDFGSLHSWSVLSKVSVRWADWPYDERKAIRGFIDAWWHATLDDFPRRVNVLEVLEFIAMLGIDIGSYLTDWGQTGTEPAALHLAWLVHDFTHHSVSSGQWYTTLDSWITGPAPARMLETAFFAASTPVVAADISDAREILELWANDTPTSRP
jgi:hypothetical protein